jgi:hypothetical protein
MRQGSVTIYTCTILSLLVIACSTAAAQKIEKLTKKEQEFYGRQISKTDFKTCDGTTISIANGQITQTNRECPGPPPIAMSERGVVGKYTTSVDDTGQKVGELIFTTSSGKVQRLFVPSTVAKGIDPGSLKKGAVISVMAGKYERAEAIKQN